MDIDYRVARKARNNLAILRSEASDEAGVSLEIGDVSFTDVARDPIFYDPSATDALLSKNPMDWVFAVTSEDDRKKWASQFYPRSTQRSDMDRLANTLAEALGYRGFAQLSHLYSRVLTEPWVLEKELAERGPYFLSDLYRTPQRLSFRALLNLVDAQLPTGDSRDI